MKFWLTRTSASYNESPKVDEAVEAVRTSIYKLKNPERTVTSEDPGWLIEIATLEELAAFCQKHGDLVVSHEGDEMEIEIYDDYRE